MTIGDWLTTAEAAARLGVSRRRINQLAAEGRLRQRAVGRAQLVSERSVAKYLETTHPVGRPRKKPAP